MYIYFEYLVLVGRRKLKEGQHVFSGYPIHCILTCNVFIFLFRDFMRLAAFSAGSEQLQGLFHRDRKSSWSTGHYRVNLYCILHVPSTPWFIVVYAPSSSTDAEVVLLYTTYITYQCTKCLCKAAHQEGLVHNATPSQVHRQPASRPVPTNTVTVGSL